MIVLISGLALSVKRGYEIDTPMKRINVWRRPLQLAALTTIGLIAALLGTGVWRVLSWICLAIPLAAGMRYLFARPEARKIPGP
jgi:hypothetical protein